MDWEGQTGAGESLFDAVIQNADSRVEHRGTPEQEALVRLKLAAVRLLPVQSVRSFLGLAHFGRRVWFYHEIRPLLLPQTRAFWDDREALIRAGLFASGGHERAMTSFRRRFLPLAHRPSTIDALLAQTSLPEQLDWAERHWFTPRWRLLARTHPLARAVDVAIRTRPAATDYRLQWRLLGRFLDLEAGPLWLTTPGHKALRAGLDRIDFLGQ